MNVFEVKGVQVSLPAGTVLGLDEQQVQRRRHTLRREGKDYVATAPVRFKKGETLRAELDLKKVAPGMLADLGLTKEQIREVRGEQPAKAPKGKTAAKPAAKAAPVADPLSAE